ncbi:sigma-70 domain-containing protein [Streptomyces sp. NPDC090445]|uniref:sigma-70 domain-containing protein n=1 Tax=Streptomyces sp. NPDC090445 TaxID=3365963 RepID=UPI003800CE03
MRGQEALSSLFGRAPTVAELAEDLGIGEEEVLEGMVASNVYRSPRGRRVPVRLSAGGQPGGVELRPGGLAHGPTSAGR